MNGTTTNLLDNLSTLAIECTKLAAETRAYIAELRKRGHGVDLYGPKGTEIRLTDDDDEAAKFR
jgi:hypothetical protein